MKHKLKPKRDKGNIHHVTVPPTRAHSLGHRLEENKRSRRKKDMRDAKLDFNEKDF